MPAETRNSKNKHDVPPPGSKPRKRVRPGRSYRRAEEDVPGPDYIERMYKLGPREGESLLTFRMRMAGVVEGRKLLLDAAQRCSGAAHEVGRVLGVASQNINSVLRTCGLSMPDILAYKPENRR